MRFTLGRIALDPDQNHGVLMPPLVNRISHIEVQENPQYGLHPHQKIVCFLLGCWSFGPYMPNFGVRNGAIYDLCGNTLIFVIKNLILDTYLYIYIDRYIPKSEKSEIKRS
jgi:hypothetical protein